MIAIATEDGVRTPEALGVSELGATRCRRWRPPAGTSGRWWTRRRSGAAATGSGPRWPPTRPRLRCLLPWDGGALAGTAEAHLVRVGPGAVEPVAGFERAPGRRDWFTPGADPCGAHDRRRGRGRALCERPRGRDPALRRRRRLVAADHRHPLGRPRGAGRAGAPGLVLAATGVGTATSEDGGAWSFAHDGLAGRYCRAVALAGDTVLLSASNGPRGGDAAVYRRPLGADGPFQRCTDGFERNIDTGCLAADGELAAFGTEDGRVSRAMRGPAGSSRPSGLPAVQALVVTDHYK